jgi:hypothetical protein
MRDVYVYINAACVKNLKIFIACILLLSFTLNHARNMPPWSVQPHQQNFEFYNEYMYDYMMFVYDCTLYGIR